MVTFIGVGADTIAGTFEIHSLFSVIPTAKQVAFSCDKVDGVTETACDSDVEHGHIGAGASLVVGKQPLEKDVSSVFKEAVVFALVDGGSRDQFWVIFCAVVLADDGDEHAHLIVG